MRQGIGTKLLCSDSVELAVTARKGLLHVLGITPSITLGGSMELGSVCALGKLGKNAGVLKPPTGRLWVESTSCCSHVGRPNNSKRHAVRTAHRCACWAAAARPNVSVWSACCTCGVWAASWHALWPACAAGCATAVWRRRGLCPPAAPAIAVWHACLLAWRGAAAGAWHAADKRSEAPRH